MSPDGINGGNQWERAEINGGGRERERAGRSKESGFFYSLGVKIGYAKANITAEKGKVWPKLSAWRRHSGQTHQCQLYLHIQVESNNTRPNVGQCVHTNQKAALNVVGKGDW